MSVCWRCNEEAEDEVELTGTNLVVCREHLLQEDRDVIDFGCDAELAELEAYFVARVERVQRIRGEIRERRRAALFANRGSGGWGQ